MALALLLASLLPAALAHPHPANVPAPPFETAQALLEDPTRRLDLPAVLDLPDDYWQDFNENLLRPGFSKSAWWVRIDVRNRGTAERQLILELAQPSLDFLDYHVFRGGRLVESRSTGDFRPFASRPLVHRHFALPLDMEAGEAATVYLRIESHSGVYDAIPLKVRERAGFRAASQGDNLLLGAYFGATLCLGLYHLLLSFSTRERLFLFYAVYLGLFALENLGLEGYGLQYLWPENPWFNRQLGITLPSLIHASATLLAVEYLNTRRRAPVLHRIMVGLTALLAIPAAMALADSIGIPVPLSFATSLFQILSALLLPVYIVVGVAVLRQGYRPAAFYVIAWIWSVLGVGIFYLQRAFGVLPTNWLTENSLSIGSVLEFLFLALALGEHFNRLKDDSLAAERQLLEMQSAQADHLETLVRERTVELRQALHRIEVLARTDELTRLHNVRAFNDIFPREFARSRRDRHLLGFALLDIDHFKRYNDHYGHAAGDEALRKVASVVTRWLRRPSDFAFRLGGEEFGILLAHADSEERAARLIEHIRLGVQGLAIPHVGNDNGVVTCSVGLAFNRHLPQPLPDNLYQLADQALYRAKAAGRNRLEISDGEPEAPIGEGGHG